MTAGGPFHSPADYCEFGPAPLSMSDLFVLLLRGHFSAAELIEFEALQGRVWVSGPASPIRIEDALVWTPRSADDQPAVTCRRGSWKPVTVGIGDRENYNVETGETSYRRFWTGTHRIICSSPESGEAELLSTEVYRFLGHFSPKIRDELGLMRFRLSEIGAPRRMKKVERRWGVAVDVEYAWTEAWSLVPAAIYQFNSFTSEIEFVPYSQYPES